MIDGKSYREVAEVLVFKDNQVYMWIKDGIIHLPGGSTDPEMPLEETCIHECREEAHFIIKNIKYIGQEVRNMKQSGWTPGKGFYTGGKVAHVFRAEYVSDYTGPVDKADIDEKILNDGKWYDLNEALKVSTSDLYTKAINDYMNPITR